MTFNEMKRHVMSAPFWVWWGMHPPLYPRLITSLIYRLCIEGKNQKSKSQG